MAGPGILPYHQQWAPPPPVPSSAPPIPLENPNRTSTDEVRTIFISGLPEDVKDRELQNLLRWLPGYEASQINFKVEQKPTGFALFSTAQLAMAAGDALQNMVFDPESNSVLRTEMAKKNLFVKRGVVADPNSFDQSKRLRTGGDYTHSGYPSPATQVIQTPFHPAPTPVWAPQVYSVGPVPPPPQYDPYGGYLVPQVALPPPPPPAPVPAPPPVGYAPVQNMKDNPPCNTLFIGNLGENIIEEELRGLFSVQPGYKQMKVLRHERNTVCFIEFDDVNSAITVHHTLQGAVLPSSGRGGVRIQFSKNPFGRRKDSSNGIAPAAVSGVPTYL
ncbi:RNA-binding (RRM/RBD/RNP motifs) family protein [Tasmannia lanceolata]|uniref:RNA-binding (RRM/RBD/RNP motifs) family protein n=1 Tax=Tasmannia lanceolata TaxID=3420 RepID=UPI004062DF01